MKNSSLQWLVCAALASLGTAACSDADTTDGSHGGDTAAGGGTTSSTDGGSGGSSASGTSGGADATGGGGGGTTEPTCPHTGNPVVDPNAFPACPTTVCGGGGHCVATSIVIAQGGQEQADQLADCDATNKCVPDVFLTTGGDFILTTCTSIAGAEGRCLSECLPALAAQKDSLPTDVCAAFERCVPCTDPLSGEDTGACHQSCDPGPTQPPVVLPKCCNGIGTCVPGSLIPPDQAGSLPVDTCPVDANDYACTPDVFIQDPNYVPEACLTESIIGGGQPGGCLPGCLITGFQANFVGQSTCPDDWKCAPCNDPLTGDPTGACS